MDKNTAQVLIDHFNSVFKGPNGDYPAVLESLAGVSAVQARWKPKADCNSIWQIVDHLTASKLWQIEMLEKGQAAAPVWIEPSGDESEWKGSILQLCRVHEELLNILGHFAENSLLKFPEPGSKQTQLELLLSIAAHEAFHAGQIDYLKGYLAGI